MVMGLDSVAAVEDLLRGHGVTITPVSPTRESATDLQTADGRFAIESARNIDRPETRVTLYRTDTAEAIPTDVNEVVKRLQKRYPTKGEFALTYPQLAGRHTFTMGVQGPNGVLGPPLPLLSVETPGELCWLNPTSGKFSYTRQLGVRSVCRSVATWTPLRLEGHIRSKHEGVWPQHEREQERIRRAEEKEMSMATNERVAQLVELALAQRGMNPASSTQTQVAKTRRKK